VLIPLLLWLVPDLFGLIEPPTASPASSRRGYRVAGTRRRGLLFRVAQLWLTKSLMTGLVWMTKILTDPFHDIALYHKAPLHLLRGELIDPMLACAAPLIEDSKVLVQELAEDAAADRPVGLCGALPPPAIGLHDWAAAMKRCSTASKSPSL